ncbi:MAG: MBL fold metallo-hydrolase, partial [Candidatus Sifarchaeia archaeon]
MIEVIWQGHACFELRKNGLTIVHDPFGNVPGISDPKAEADIILCSHS